MARYLIDANLPRWFSLWAGGDCELVHDLGASYTVQYLRELLGMRSANGRGKRAGGGVGKIALLLNGKLLRLPSLQVHAHDIDLTGATRPFD